MTQISALTSNPSPALTDVVGVDGAGNVTYKETANALLDLLTALTAITTLADGDQIAVADASDSNFTRKITWQNAMVQAAAYVQTYTNKRITKRVQSAASTATVNVDSDSYDMVVLTAQAEALTVGAPTGTPTQGQTLLYRFTDNATGRAITWNAIFRATDVALPTTTVAGKTLYVGFIYTTTETKFD